MANVWIEVLDTPIDGHQKGEIFEIDEHYAKRFVEHEKAQIVEAPVVSEPEPVVSEPEPKVATQKAAEAKEATVKPQGKAASDAEANEKLTGKAAEVANPKKSA
jgi:hypothetical protein